MVFNNQYLFSSTLSPLTTTQLLNLSAIRFGAQMHLEKLLEEKEEETQTELVTDDFQDMQLGFWEQLKIIYYNSKGFNYSSKNAHRLGRCYERSLSYISINYYRYKVSTLDNYQYKYHEYRYKTNFELAYAWYCRSADMRNVEGMYRFGCFLKTYYRSPPFFEFEEDEEETTSAMYRLYYAHDYLEQASEQGHLEAMYSLSQLYREGKVYIDPKDSIKQADKWLVQAAKKGHIKAQLDQAANDVAQNKNQIQNYVNLCEKYAKKGNSYAQCQLADYYLEGKSTSPTIEKAKKILIDATKKKDSLAAYRLANILLNEGNKDLALHYYIFSFYHGYTPGLFAATAHIMESKSLFEDESFYDKVYLGVNFTAVCNELALHQLNGLYGCEASRERAVFWYKRSAAHDDAYAQVQLQQLDKNADYPSLHSVSCNDKKDE